MSARTRTLLLSAGALALALALGLYAYFGVLRADQRAAAAKEAKEKLVAPVAQPDGGTALVRYDKLVVTAKGDTVELGRVPDASWVIARPFRARADVRVAEDLVSTLQVLRLNRVVDEQPKEEDLVRYGLKPPRFLITATAESAPPLVLSGGVENSFDSTCYLQRAGDARVYAVDVVSCTSLDKGLQDLRARDVLGARDLGLVAIQLKSTKHDWAVSREPEHPWAFQRPAGLAADGSALSQWVASLGRQQATKFLVDSPAERKRTGVEKPQVDASFRRLEETARVRLAAGPLDTDPAFVLREDSFGVTLAELPHAALGALDVPASELRDRRVLIFQPAQVQRIRLLPEGGGPAIVVQREMEDGGPTSRWVLASRTPQPASASKVSTLLYALEALRWQPVDDVPPKDPGLGGTARTVLLEDASGKVLATLVLGKTASRNGPTVWTRTSSGEVVEVDTSRLRALPSRPEDLLEVASGAPGSSAPP